MVVTPSSVRRWLAGWVIGCCAIVAGCDSWQSETPPPPSDVEVAERLAERDLDQAAQSGGPIESTSAAGATEDGSELMGGDASGRTSAAPSAGTALRSYNEWSLAETAADALGRIGTASVPELVRGLQHPNARVRRDVSRVLARIGPDAVIAVPELRQLLQDEDDEVRQAAARALGQIGPGAQSAVPDLIRLLESDQSP
ncbi:MAG: HEAT repeat domain-containing protein [Planctomycetales bacterium]|nr:HEAT repeat domain-containing protein [Planctomycetales bacterium]